MSNPSKTIRRRYLGLVPPGPSVLERKDGRLEAWGHGVLPDGAQVNKRGIIYLDEEMDEKEATDE